MLFCFNCYVDLVVQKKVKAAVVFHPTFLTVDDAPTVKESGVPMLFCCAENDVLFTPPLRGAFEKELTGGKWTFVEFPGTIHGFSARPEGETAIAEAKKAHARALEYFKQQA